MLALIPATVVALASAASAQEAPPPIDVPTTPVPQGPAPKAPPPAAKPAPKAPPPAPSPATPKKDETSAPAKDGKPSDGSEAPKFNNEGVFKVSGTPGSGNVGGKKPTAATTVGKKVAKVSNAIVAEWPGFRNTPDGGSEVMVEFSKAMVSPSEHKAAGTITYVFKGAHVIKSNNQNPLLTVHFNTPVLSARLVPKKGELHLVIDLRPGVDAIPGAGMRAGAEAGGQQFFVKFPAGSYLPKNDEADDDYVKKSKKTVTPSTTKTPPPTTTKKPTGKGPSE